MMASRAAACSAMRVSSSVVRTVPVGLCGVLTSTSRVRAVKAARTAAGSTWKPPGEGEDRRGERLGGARGDQHLGVRVDGEAVVAGLVRGDGLAQLGDPAARRVLVVALVDRVHRGVLEVLGSLDVGEALAEVDRAGTGGELGRSEERRVGKEWR